MAKISIIILILCSFYSLSLSGKERIVVATFDPRGLSPWILKHVMHEIYEQAGAIMIVRAYPPKRSPFLANSGVIDGELYRTKEAISKEKFPNLVRLPIRNWTVKFSAFTNLEPFPVNGWKSLSSYKIGSMKGIFIVEKKTKGMVRISTDTLPAIVKMMNLGRVDVIVLPEIDGLFALSLLNLNQEIKLLQPSLEAIPTYHFLHKKHQNLIKRLTKVMERMEADGSLSELIARKEREGLQIKLGKELPTP